MDQVSWQADSVVAFIDAILISKVLVPIEWLLSRCRRRPAIALPDAVLNVNLAFEHAKEKSLPDKGGPFWFARNMQIWDTGYDAYGGPWVYYDPKLAPVLYSISVEVRTDDGVSHVLYHVNIQVDELPPGFIDKPIQDIVLYDPTVRLVSFMAGDRLYEYRLPGPRN